jgi:hypothetical protein
MFGPVPLRAELMVLDTNILGLSRVLYHYDRRLNLFKGTRDHDSLYPCAELMAIRLLLLKKLHRHETVSMAAITRHAALFAPGSREAFGAELSAMGLRLEEFRFLKAVFASEPAFLKYMRHPFIISTLKKIGVAEADAFTLSADLRAGYHQLSGKLYGGNTDARATVAIVPAMIPMSDEPGGLEKSAEYVQRLNQIRTAIETKLAERRGMPEAAGSPAFFIPDRPVTIYPENADRVVGQLCPRANFVVILLGKNVYRSIHIDPDRDIHPHKKWIYLDVDDVRYQQIDAEMETTAGAILPALSAIHATSPAS